MTFTQNFQFDQCVRKLKNIINVALSFNLNLKYLKGRKIDKYFYKILKNLLSTILLGQQFIF